MTPNVIVAAHRRWVNRAVAQEVDRQRARWLWGAFAALLVAAAPFAIYLLAKNDSLELSARATSLRLERDRLVEEVRRLEMERTALESLETIEPWALGRHGMVRPSAQHRIVVRRAPPHALPERATVPRPD